MGSGKPRKDPGIIHDLTLVQGVEGLAIYLNDYRIAGPKPWGGGEAVKSWVVRQDILDQGIKEKR